MKKHIKSIVLFFVMYIWVQAIANADTVQNQVNESAVLVKKDVTQLLTTVSLVPGKVGNQFNIEVEKTKEFQKANWAKVKVQWYNLISKFSSN